MLQSIPLPFVYQVETCAILLVLFLPQIPPIQYLNTSFPSDHALSDFKSPHLLQIHQIWQTLSTLSLAPTGVTNSPLIKSYLLRAEFDFPPCPTIGLGRALAATFLARSSVTIIAAVRNPSHESSKSLDSLPKGPNSKVILIQYDAKNEQDTANIPSVLKKEDITYLDVVIANAGIANDIGPLASVTITAFKDHVETNAYGPLLLFQAIKPFLEKAKQPKFVALGSPLGSIGGMEQRPFPMGAYGASKAMLHYIMRKIHFENEKIISFPVDPG